MSSSAIPQTFHPFPLLPKELRLQIWEHAIPQERMIRVSLQPHVGRRYELAAEEPRYQQRNHLNKPITGERYRAVVNGKQLNSKLMRVNSEARNVALAFYRIHIPVYITGQTYTERSTLYFNPEYDFLHIRADAPVKETLIDFLWDLRAYDPKGVGLKRLGVDLLGLCANDLQYLRKSDLLLIRQRTILVETLSQLSDVWFINLQATSWASMGMRLQRSKCRFLDVGVPFWEVPRFQRVGLDVRSGVDEELEQVSWGEVDPREVLFRWRKVLRTWGFEFESNNVDYRLVVGNVPLSLPKSRSLSVTETRQVMSDLSLVEKKTRNPAGSVGSQVAVKVGDSDTQTAARGFWLFPLESVGELVEGERLADMPFSPRRVLDMRSHRPELGLSTLN